MNRAIGSIQHEEATEVAYEYVNKFYGLEVKPGMTVRMKDRFGVVARKRSYNHYVHVRFEGSKHDVPVHPMDLKYDNLSE